MPPRQSLDEILAPLKNQTAPRRSLDEIFNEAFGKKTETTVTKTSGQLDQESANSSSALFPAQTGEGPGSAVVKSIGNTPSSLINTVKGGAEALIHPLRTGKGIIDTIKGGGGALGRTLVEKTKFGDIKTSNGSTLRDNLQKMKPDISEETFNNVVSALHDRYGSLENAQRTATNDPFGFGADVMAVLSGGAGLAKRIAPETTESVGRVTDAITKPVSDLNIATREKIAGKIQGSAEKSLSQALNPTKEPFKTQTQQILPELSSRRKIAFTQKGLSSKYEAELERSGQEIDDAWKQLPPDSQEKVKPITDALENTKNNFIVDGVIIEPNAWKAADDLQKIILDVSKEKETIPSESLRKVRQVWDETIAKSKGFTKDISDQDKIFIKKEATNAIRNVLAEAHPSIDKLNKEYSLWRKASDIIEETVRRKTGQDAPLGTKVLAAGGIGGGSAVAGLKGAAIGATAVAAISLAFKSTLWKTLSAAAKSKLAQAIFEANPTEIKNILAPIVGEQALSGLSEASQ